MKAPQAIFLPLAAAVALLLWETHLAVGPAAVMLAAWALLWPVRETRAGRAIQYALVLLIAFWILHQARWVVYPLVAGTLLAYVLLPLVEWFARRRVPRPAAALLALLPVLLFAGLTLFLLIPALIQQVSLVVSRLPDVYNVLLDRLAPLLLKVGARPPAVPGGEVVPPAAIPAPPWINQITQHAADLLRAAQSGLLGVGRGIGQVLPWFGVLLLTPVTAYYLMVDWRGLGEGVLFWLPPRLRSPVRRLSSESQTALRIYVRGQVLVAGIEAVLFSTAFALAGLPHPIALGVLGGLLSLIPIVGFWITALLVALSAITSAGLWGTLLKAAIGLFGINILEGQVLVPKVQGSGLGVHPLAVLLGVLLLGTLFGLPGMLLAVPLMGVIRAIMPEIRAEWTRRIGTAD